MDTTLRYKNDNQTGQFGNQRAVNVVGARETVGMQKAKRVKDSTYHKEKMLLCKQAEKGVQLQAEQSDSCQINSFLMKSGFFASLVLNIIDLYLYFCAPMDLPRFSNIANSNEIAPLQGSATFASSLNSPSVSP
ncbi:hypothetical protein Tco_0841140 [Tanacetum coccineum]|uniref:Uncharacterized protein n=1 Tax=Tanacetum coccineum TaxID=301880 RepID=A0ABQ5AZF1_9ASTR